MTLIEVLVVVIALAALVLLLLPAFTTNTRVNYRSLKDSTQVRGILQGMVIWAQNNQDDYPLPSVIDAGNTTVAATGSAKDTTSNIFSLLIYNGYIPTEMFVSPGESNDKVDEYTGYEYDAPAAAVAPVTALWDPAFHATPLAAYNIAGPKNPVDQGNNSYAHALPTGSRRALWGSTFVATEVAIGSRGPRINAVTKGAAPKVTIDFDAKSNTLRFFDPQDSWSGNVGYNDNHVVFATQMDGGTYIANDGVEWRDVLFYDEPDDAAGTNAWLGVWAVTGDAKENCVTWID